MIQLAPALMQGIPGGPELLVILFVLIIMVGGFLLWVGVAYWVYKDAEKRNMDNAVLWAAVAFFLGLLGLVVYFFAREDA